MKHISFIYWQDGDDWLGYLEQFPAYPAQGSSLEDLNARLVDFHRDLTLGIIPYVRRRAELELQGSMRESPVRDKFQRTGAIKAG